MDKVVYASAPSNIAFVKYWGKVGRQYPMNPSLSMTLKNCRTETKIQYRIEKGKGRVEEFLFEGLKNQNFSLRIEKYLKSINDIFPLANDLVLKVDTRNTFPHSAGIASSASAMAALCTCLVQIEENVLDKKSDDFKQRVSVLARLASGSACRSIFPKYAYWGESQLIESSNEFALPFNKIHENFENMDDFILIVSSDEKSVSSSAGHSLMNGHFYKNARLDQANENFRSLLSCLENGDLETFGDVLENEALSLHALMMTSSPSYILLKSGSLNIIEKLKAWRSKTNIPCFFTIDAGPNIHLICPQRYRSEVKNFIEDECKDDIETYIHDEIGKGIEIG